MSETPEGLRAAIAAGRYEEADELLNGMRRQAEHTADPAALARLLELIEEARRAVLAHRANLATQLARLRFAPRSYGAGAPPAHTFRLEG
jgi:hypothetical protein